MFGSLIKIITVPIDIVEATFDVMCGGDGSKESRAEGSPFGEVRDSIAETVDDIEKDIVKNIKGE